MTGTESAHQHNGERAARLSNAVVRLISEHTGRGPTKARSYIHDDLVTVVLRDSLTKGERSLVRHGEGELVLRVRRGHQAAMRSDLVGAVEDITGRTVAAFLSGNHIDPDVAVESFVLEEAPAVEPAHPPTT